jgi:hypothetical protein
MKTQFITDSLGQKMAVILPIKDYQKLLDSLEDLADIRLYDQAKKEDDGSRVSFDSYLSSRKIKRQEWLSNTNRRL